MSTYSDFSFGYRNANPEKWYAVAGENDKNRLNDQDY